MPISLRAVAYAAEWSCILAGQQAYNADLAAGVLPSTLKPLLAENLIDLRTRDGRDSLNQQTLDNAAFPRVVLRVTGYREAQPAMRTFGWQNGNAGCDVVLPATVTLVRTIYHDSITVADDGQTPLESYLDAAERAVRPKFGIPYCRDATFDTRLTDESAFAAMRTVSRRTMTFDLRPHLADLAGD